MLLEEALGDLVLFLVTLGVLLVLAGLGLRQLLAREAGDPDRRRELVGWGALATALVGGWVVVMARGTLVDLLQPAPVAGEEGYHEHTPHHGGLVSMWRDYHVEVTRFRGDEYRVYLSDAYRREIAWQFFTGTLTVKGVERELLPGPGGPYRFAVFPPAEIPVEVLVHLEIPGGQFRLKFLFDTTSPLHPPDRWCTVG